MKKQSSTRFLMWVMVIWLHAHFSIAAVLSKSNDTTTSVFCDGSVENCLNVDHLDSQLPTISSSHFRRILTECDKIYSVARTNDPGNPAGCGGGYGYRKGGASPVGGVDSRCSQAPYLRVC